MKLIELCEKCLKENSCGTAVIAKLMDVASGEVADREPTIVTCADYKTWSDNQLKEME